MLSRASDLDPSNPRLMADLGRSSRTKPRMPGPPPSERSISARPVTCSKKQCLEPKNGHSYGLWALTLYDRGRYAESWEKVHRAQQLQAVIPEKFLRMLREKMPEPKRP